MRAFSKVLLASCLLAQVSFVCADPVALTPPNATKESSETMENVQKLFKEHGESGTLSLIKGFESHKHEASKLEIETALGKNPVLCVEGKDGKLLVVASRMGEGEDKTDLTNDKTHQAIVAELKKNGSDKPALLYYTDKTGRKLELLAYGLALLEKSEGNPKSDRCFYCATEKEVTEIPKGAIVVE